jgi:hypothetical protein
LFVFVFLIIGEVNDPEEEGIEELPGQRDLERDAVPLPSSERRVLFMYEIIVDVIEVLNHVNIWVVHKTSEEQGEKCHVLTPHAEEHKSDSDILPSVACDPESNRDESQDAEDSSDPKSARGPLFPSPDVLVDMVLEDGVVAVPDPIFNLDPDASVIQ